MSHYEVSHPSTLLLRIQEPDRAGPALGMLDRCLPGAVAPTLAGTRVGTLSDVSSDRRQPPVAACLLSHEPGERSAWVPAFAVDVPFRGRGLGRRLLTDLHGALRAEGAREVFVRVPPDTPWLAARLAAHGFVTAPARLPPGWPSMATTSANEPSWRWLVGEL